MSQKGGGKITSKNLHYNSTLPPFLARLRGDAIPTDGPDPILAARRRPTKPRSGSAEAEDAPVVVDEEGNNVVSVKVGADGRVTEIEEAEKTGGQDGREEGEEEKGGERGGEKVAAVGVAKKRKVGRVIGGEDGDEEPDRQKEKRDKGGSVKKKGEKKAKKVKLSFGDDEG